jgi:hypothetical protein
LGDVHSDGVRKRIYSLPIVVGGATLLAVLAAIVAAVLAVSQSRASVVHRRTAVAVPPVSSTAFAPSTSSGTPPYDGRQFFGEVPQLPLLGQVLAPWY